MNRRKFFKVITGIIAGFFVSKSKAILSHNWTQIVISDEDETIKIYLNGQECATPSGEFSISFWVSSSGKMNNVNLYNRALSPEEIERNYLSG